MRSIRWWEWALMVAVAVIALVYVLEFAPRWPL